MRVFRKVSDVGDELWGGAICIGNFDGVHLGHLALIEKALTFQKKTGVLTFTPHPSEILDKNACHFYLTSDQEKLRILKKSGLDVAIIQPIDEQFLRMSARSFVDEILVRKLGVWHVVVGDDFAFGACASGNVYTLKEMGREQGFNTHVVKQISIDQERISSTNIRKFLRLGEVDKAARMLNRPFSLRGIVASGKGLGGVLGFKTANIHPPKDFGLKNGVYATITRALDNPTKDFLSITNVGVRPTLGHDQDVVVETHCLFENPSLYQMTIEIFFVERLRDEKKFLSVMALQEQVKKDCQALRQMYARAPYRFRVED